MRYQNKIRCYLFLCALSAVSLFNYTYAAVNPFKITRSLQFDDIPWVASKAGVIKTGQENRNDGVYYYHLIISPGQLIFRLGKDEPNGWIKNSRPLHALDLVDLKIDKKRLPRFQWCLDNQSNISSPVLRQNTKVSNDVCIIRGGNGEFIINLDVATLNYLRRAKILEITVRPFKHPVIIEYGMTGLHEALVRLESPKPRSMPVKAKPVDVKVAAPIIKKQPVSKNCLVRPPEVYKVSIKPQSFLCSDKRSKQRAEEIIQQAVQALKQEEMEEQKQQASVDDAVSSDMIEKEKEWMQKKKSMWVKRCKEYWGKGSSPCFCRPYLQYAPSGTVDTCNK
ncbi:MAG: hypothetical protein OEY89_05100 [Gammaproteobacteria bacterium]|nr:hypothetical protein [Gammaproteobacteria bacterium]